MKNWADLSDKEKSQIEREYCNGKEPGDIAPKYSLKAKQISDQAYRKNWSRPASAKKGSADKKGGKAKAASKAKTKKR